MKRGKKICKALKEVRLQVAKANDIEYAPTECHHEGDCAGTCPKCEAEVQYLERQLQLRRHLGKAVAVVGVSMGLAAITACKTHKIFPPKLAGDVEATPPITAETDGYISPKQTDTLTIDTVAAPEKPADGIYGQDSELPDFVAPPTYPGGMAALSQFLSENIKYPQEAVKANITGRVLVGFIVDVDGALSETRVEHSVHPLLDREALRVIRLMPSWNPAKDTTTGKPVKVRYHLPVNFKL
jgi:TonB family protein